MHVYQSIKHNIVYNRGICNIDKYITHVFIFIPKVDIDFKSRLRLGGIILSLRGNMIEVKI